MGKIKIKRKVPICYSGSLLQQNYGESVNNHGFLLWDVENRDYIEYNIPTEYGFYKFSISSIDDIENDNEILLNI